MKIVEAHKLFDILLDKVASDSYAEVTPYEKDVFINLAIVEFVKTRYGKNNLYQAGFEEIQKRTDDLRSLVKNAFPEITAVPYENNTYRVHTNMLYLDEDKNTLNEDTYWFYLKGRALVNDSECGLKYKECKQVQQDDLNRVLKDPFNKPTKNRVILYFEDNDIFVKCADNNTIDNFKLTFLKQPAKVNVGTYGGQIVEFDLPEHTHEEIIKMSVKNAIEVIESPRGATYVNNLNTIE